MRDTQRKVEQYLKDEGFKVLRICGSGHRIWTDGQIRITVGGSISDHRAFNNIRCQVKRARRFKQEICETIL